MISKQDALEKAIKVGEAYALSSSNTYPTGVIQEVYEKIVEIAKRDGILME